MSAKRWLQEQKSSCKTLFNEYIKKKRENFVKQKEYEKKNHVYLTYEKHM